MRLATWVAALAAASPLFDHNYGSQFIQVQCILANIQLLIMVSSFPMVGIISTEQHIAASNVWCLPSLTHVRVGDLSKRLALVQKCFTAIFSTALASSYFA